MSLLGKMLGFGRSSDYDTGIRLFDQGQYEEAIEAFARALQMSTKRPDPLTQRLATFYTAESYTHLGHEALKTSHWERAAQCFSSALDIHPHYADLHFHLACSLYKQQKPDMALASLAHATAINARYARAYMLKGQIHYSQANYETALASLALALEYEPGFKTEVWQRFQQAHETEQYTEAQQLLDTVLHTDIEDIQYHFKLGDDFYKRELFAESVEEYHRALSINPHYPDIRCHLGLALRQLGRLPEAISELRQAVDANPRYIDGLLYLGIALEEAGSGLEASQFFTQVLELDPDHPAAREHIQRYNQRAA